MQQYLVAVAAAIGLMLTPVAASAAQYITNLEYVQASSGGHLASPLGTVTLTEGSGFVDILVDFGDPELIQNIVDTGSHVAFAFNLVDAGGNPADPTGTVSFPTGVEFVDPTNGGYEYAGLHYTTTNGPHPVTTLDYYDQAPFKNFTNAIISTAGAGGNHQVAPPLEFRIYASGISFFGTSGVHFTSTIDDSVVDGYAGGWWFAADVQMPNNNTFTVAGRDFCTVGVDCGGGGVPEPSSWALMLLGFGGLGAMLRRRRGQTRATFA